MEIINCGAPNRLGLLVLFIFTVLFFLLEPSLIVGSEIVYLFNISQYENNKSDTPNRGEAGLRALANGNNTAEIGFEQQIWGAADILRGNMDAAEYKHVVLGLIFLKYISDKFEERYRELEADHDDVEDKDAYTEKNVFFVPRTARWERWLAAVCER